MKKQQTKQEAKKSNLIESAIALLVGIAAIIVGLIFSPSLSLLSLIGVFIIISAFLVGFFTNQAINRSYCSNCGTKYNYDNDITWEEVERIDKGDSVVSVVEFSCVCPKCKEERTFRQNFKKGYYDKDKNCWREKNITSAVRNYFIK